LRRGKDLVDNADKIKALVDKAVEASYFAIVLKKINNRHYIGDWRNRLEGNGRLLCYRRV